MRDLTIGAFLTGAVLLGGAASAQAADPSASIPATPAGRWQGTATEVPGIYSGPAGAKVTLDLKPDGTFTETWKDADRERSASGTWREQGKGVVLESTDPSRAKLTLRRSGDTLYTIANEPLPSGRETTTAIELHPAAS